MCGLLHTWISIFDIAIPYLRPNKATNWNFLVPSGLFVTKAPCSSPFSPAQHNCWREESPNMWNTFLGQVIIFFLWVNEGNYKNWGEENDLWTCSNCLDFFPDFLLLQNLEFWAFEGPFRAKKTSRCERRRYLNYLPQSINGPLDTLGVKFFLLFYKVKRSSGLLRSL